jgi:hypothetical protein
MAAVVGRAEVRAEEWVASDKERDDSISLEKDDNEPVKNTALRSVLSTEDAEWLAEVSPQEQGKIYHKIDRRLVPMLALLYLIAHLDRASKFDLCLKGFVLIRLLSRYWQRQDRGPGGELRHDGYRLQRGRYV